MDATGATSSATSDVTSTSSSENQIDANVASSTTPDVTDAPSSEATPETERERLLAVVKSVVETDADTTDTTTSDTTTGTDTQKPDDAAKVATDADPDPTDAELATYTKGAQSRIKDLVKARKEVEQQFEAVLPEVEAHRSFVEYLDRTDLRTDDVNLLLGIGAALRAGDFKTFLNGVRPYIELAEQAVGERVPATLQEQVDQGLITEEHARELAQARFAVAHTRGQLTERQTADQAAAQEAAKHSVRTATQSWENSVRAQDPDYGVKQDAVRRYAQALIQERGLPRSPQEAVRYANDAYAEVNKTFAAARPSVRPTRQMPGSVHIPSSGSAEPKSLREAALLGLRRG